MFSWPAAWWRLSTMAHSRQAPQHAVMRCCNWRRWFSPRGAAETGKLGSTRMGEIALYGRLERADDNLGCLREIDLRLDGVKMPLSWRHGVR